MAISVGDRFPDASFCYLNDDGLETVTLESLSKGRKLVLFGLPGAFTRTCSATHLPSFIRTAAQFRQKGVDHIVCVSVNDPFVMKAWAVSSGATDAGIMMLADADASFTKAAGLEFSTPQLGFIDRCKRFSAYVEDGEIRVLNFETQAGVCDISSGETLLEQI